MRIIGVVILLAIACAATTGCSSNGTRTPTEGQTMIPAGRGRLPTEPYSPVDQPGQVPYDGARVPRPETEGSPGVREDERSPSPAVERALEGAVPPLAEPFDPSATPTSVPANAGAGVFQVVGGVVAEVNNTPIFADKVINDIAPVLAAGAKKFDAVGFRAFAAKEIEEQVRENIERELEFAAAERVLDERDKERAKFMAERWRQQVATAAGGSVAAAQRMFAQQGRDFEADVYEQYRRFLSFLYMQKKIHPLMQINAADMRAYYNANLAKQFTVRAAAQFEMIQVDPVKSGSREKAKGDAEDFQKRAAGGEDFAALVKYGHRQPLRKSDGELPWVDKGAFVLPAVEEAAWKLQPGQVSGVIEDGGKFYIVKLEQKREGRVRPFEEEQTQEDIRTVLSKERFGPLRQKRLNDLRADAIIRTDEKMLQSALDIAMQRYPYWAGK